ncbi:hypothetical protein SGRA_0010 [Saprospira grandis str. Lewin]|uniref:Uncharacterized protein n=1 Tax=Saprospira grandis (strain Lewin) TaxID=984262 RepID=H6L3S0_SAPGL|nr:hypothetical protein SGRA_0010 [Saprospira grandis str. Lewin]
MGPPAFGGRYVRQLAARSALRKKQVFAWSAALPHCLPSLGRLAFGHGGFAAICSLKAAAILVGPWSFLPQRLKSPCFVYGKEVLCFQVLRLSSCRPIVAEELAVLFLNWLLVLTCSHS